MAMFFRGNSASLSQLPELLLPLQHSHKLKCQIKCSWVKPRCRKKRGTTRVPEAQLSLLFGNVPVMCFVAAHFVAIFVHGYFWSYCGP